MTSRTETLVLVAERRRVADFLSLTKPRVVAMVLVTTYVGYHLGSGGVQDYVRLVHTLIGTALAAAGTLALNQFLERDVDARMRRTRGRPLPDGRLMPGEALVFGALATLTGLAYLVVAVDLASAVVTAATVVLYLFAYTPLKLVTPLCLVIGAIPGALPPVTGWIAARGQLGVGAGVLFSILFLWQLPHTLAIARLYRDDYADAGIRVLPVVDPRGASTERQIVAGCLALLAVGLLPTLVGLAGPVYFFGALALGGMFLACGVAQAIAPSAAAARRLLLASVLYLPLLLGLMALDKVG
ncbi:MAG: protoheme IX farnesyltransferase [Candidatus Rokubacteria bacterium]|nr:protoheme IX farnesyltransferase [Candidatus Rokubacteria bacterium]